MKRIVLLLVLLLLLGACSNEGALHKERTKAYQAFWDAILNQDRFETVKSKNGKFQARNFTIEASFEKGDSGSNQYIVTINNPRRAMYDMSVLVLDEDADFSDKVMKPSAGIWEDGAYNLIPEQTDTERGYYKGIRLMGETDKEEVTLKILVEWHDVSLLESYQEFFKIPLKATTPKEAE